jgi:hypothetical protein
VAYYFKDTTDNITDVIGFAGGPTVSTDDNTYKYIVIGASLGVAFLLAFGAAYCHGVLNQQFQDPDVDAEKENAAEEKTETQPYHTLPEETHPTTTLQDSLLNDTLYDEESSESPVHENAAAENPDNYALTGLQKALLAADGFCHGAGKAGAVMGIVDSLTTYLNPSFNTPVVRIVTQCAATLFGASTAVADVNTCKKSLVKHNKEIFEAEKCKNRMSA